MPRSTRTQPTAINQEVETAAAAVHSEPLTTEVPASLLSDEQLCSVLESLLFVAGRPLEIPELRRLLLVEDARLRRVVTMLGAECERQARGLRVQRQGDSVQFVSAPENARFVAALLGLPTQVKLTTAALETLAVVAYRQPMTRTQIEFIRGVNSDRALANLMQHGLVDRSGPRRHGWAPGALRHDTGVLAAIWPLQPGGATPTRDIGRGGGRRLPHGCSAAHPRGSRQPMKS